jgi:hypothetical protein
VGRGASAAALGLGLLAGCHPRPAPPEQVAELRQVQAEVAALDRGLEELQDRLLVAHARLGTDALLRERHGQVAQVACQNLEEHWAGIARYQEEQRDKQQQQRQARMASVELGGTAAPWSQRWRGAAPLRLEEAGRRVDGSTGRRVDGTPSAAP